MVLWYEVCFVVLEILCLFRKGQAHHLCSPIIWTYTVIQAALCIYEVSMVSRKGSHRALRKMADLALRRAARPPS